MSTQFHTFQEKNSQTIKEILNLIKKIRNSVPKFNLFVVTKNQNNVIIDLNICLDSLFENNGSNSSFWVNSYI